MASARNATVIVVGAGPAGLGAAGLLKKCGIDVVVLERGEIGQTFKAWPKETRFISPSFTGNFFSCPDLNAITPDSSPAFSCQTQHPNGEQYAKYLRDMCANMGVDVATGTEVSEVCVERREKEIQAKSMVDSCGLYNKDLATSKRQIEDQAVGMELDDSAPGQDTKKQAEYSAVQQQLCEAVQNGNLAVVRELLETGGADPHTPGKDATRRPLYFAAKAGHLDVSTLLLEKGADLVVKTDDGATALLVAAQTGQVDLVAMLLARKCDPNQATTDDGQTPLHVASQDGHLAVVDMLLKEKADPTIADTEDGRTPLWAAAANNFPDVIAKLMEYGASPNQEACDGSTPLFVATDLGYVEAVEALLMHSDNDTNKATTDEFGATPLLVSAEAGHTHIVKALLKHVKTNPNYALKKNGATPLVVACDFGNEDVVAALLSHKDTDPNVCDNDGRTALIVAAENGDEKIVAMLLSKDIPIRADPSLTDMNGMTAIRLAEEEGHSKVVDLLRDLETDDGKTGTADESKHRWLPDITLKTSKGDYTCKFVIWAGGEFQFPNRIPDTIRVGHGTGYKSYADVPRGNHVVIGGGESGIDITHFLVGLGDNVTILDASEPWNSRESDSSLGLSPYTFDRLHALQATGKVTFIGERADSITATEVKTKSHTFKLTNPAIDATGYDIQKSLAGQLFKYDGGIPQITDYDESTVHKNVFLVGPHVQHGGIIFCFIYKYRQRFAVIAKQVLERLGAREESEVIEEYARKNFLLEDLSECGDDCAC